MYKDEPIVLYDGDCGFCNKTVSYVLKYDKSESIHFAAIQSDFTAALFKKNKWPSPDLSTFYFIEKGVLSKKSTAALHLAKYFKMPQRLLRVFFIVPALIRNAIYDFIAKRRQRISKGFCVMPEEKQKSRFLS